MYAATNCQYEEQFLSRLRQSSSELSDENPPTYFRLDVESFQARLNLSL